MDDSDFWLKISTIAARTKQGAIALYEVWPEKRASLERKDHSRMSSLYGRDVPMTNSINVVESEIRLDREDESKVALAILVIEGKCITRQEVQTHYPTVKLTDTPSSPAPNAKAYWTAYGDWGMIAFGFPNKNEKCVGNVVFDPDEVPPSHG